MTLGCFIERLHTPLRFCSVKRKVRLLLLLLLRTCRLQVRIASFKSVMFVGGLESVGKLRYSVLMRRLICVLMSCMNACSDRDLCRQKSLLEVAPDMRPSIYI